MGFYGLVLAILAVWRITHFLVLERGPWNVVLRLRGMAGNGFWGELLDCFHCSSIWIAAPFAIFLGQHIGETLLLWLALSAGAILLQQLSGAELSLEPPVSTEEGEDYNALLRQTEAASAVGDTAPPTREN